MANAYTATTDVTGFIPNYYDKIFLERLLPGPVMMDYCLKKQLPSNTGKVAYFPRMVNSSTMVSAYKLTEATIIDTEKIDDAQVSATIEQFGNAKALTDLTQLTAINGTVEETVRELADQAKNILDKRILQESYGTSASPTGAGFSVWTWNTVGNADLGTSTSAFGTYVGKVEFRMTAETIDFAVNKMRARNVQPLEDGLFGLVVHTNTATRLLQDSNWKTAYQYTDPENLRKGVAGSYGGAKIQIDNNIYTSANGSNGDTLYYSILLGRGGLGVTQLDGGVKTYAKKPNMNSTFDPINQFVSFGWKANMVPVRLNVSCGLIVITADA